MRIILKKSTNIIFNEDKIIFQNLNTLFALKKTKILQKLIEMIAEGSSIQELEAATSKEDAEQIISFLFQKNMIRKLYINNYLHTIFEKSVHFWSEFVDDPNLIPELIEQKTVLIVGLGGVGCVALQHLLGIGVRKFICVDNDTVDKSNFNRQFCFKYKDIGKLKTDVVSDYVLSINPLAEIKTYNKFINSSSDLKTILKQHPVDIVICCADKPPVLLNTYLLEASIEYNVPISFTGIGVFDGTWGPLITEKVFMERYLKFQNHICAQRKKEGILINTTPASIGYTNTIISTFFIKDIIEWLTGVLDNNKKNKMFSYDFTTNKQTTIKEI